MIPWGINNSSDFLNQKDKAALPTDIPRLKASFYETHRLNAKLNWRRKGTHCNHTATTATRSGFASDNA